MHEYVKIDRDILISTNGKISVDLYFRRVMHDGTEEFVLFAKSGLGAIAFKKIANNPVGALYIKSEDYEEYFGGIEKGLGNIVNSTDISFDDKTKIVYKCANGVIKDLFDEPNSNKNIKRSSELIKNLINFSLKDVGAIKGLMGLSEKDYYTFTHCVHVSVFSIGLGKIFGITDRKDLHALGLGALLHDVGKSRIDQNILNKPGKLTPEEFEEIKRHPRLGYEMYDGILPEQITDIILHHHEKFNGKGYPDGLYENQISLFAKIVALADVYDALTTNRVYAKARNPFEAIMIMKNDMVGHFAEEEFINFIKVLGPEGNKL